MKLKDGVIVQEMDDRVVLIDASSREDRFQGIINMNRTAAYIAQLLEKETTKEEIVKALTDKYDVSSEIADANAQKVIDQFHKVGLLM
ncbi:MAG: PqqD family protein [Lachnospiraceae bacterium]|nr:PqqD family protein [Lachnospiraceae bacterium]MBR4607856.1 PqqD family protein [Lachnospiraceae bacterium]MBR6149874.1 PqqD family protein [Lachnospiraceae bacterium]